MSGGEGNSRGVDVYGAAVFALFLCCPPAPLLRAPAFFAFPTTTPASPAPPCVLLPSRERAPKGCRTRVISRARGAFSPQRGVKSHFPRSWRILPHSGKNERSRSPLSIRALRSARNGNLRHAEFLSENRSQDFPFRPTLSRAWSRMTGVGNSLK